MLLALAAVGAVAALVACTNDPFDPLSVANKRPVAKLFIGPIESDTLNATSYYHRTFYWSGSDQDGFVVEFHVTVETVAGQPEPWVVTNRTDTTMTFLTDDTGHAEATIRLACRDNRGAMSDTVSQYIPLRNFPPVVNFMADFDTVRWSFGATNFRFFALDLDGNETMSDSFLYKLDTADTTIVRVQGQPDADPALCWVKHAMEEGDPPTFEVELRRVEPAPARTLTVSVTDEAAAETRYDWTWTVREAKGPVLLMADGTPSINQFYRSVMDSLFGPGEWSRYEIYLGMPDRLWVLTETFRQFDAVFWYTGGTASGNLKGATGALTEYLAPTAPGVQAGRFLLASKAATGSSSNLPYAFIQNVLGVSPTGAPPNSFYAPVGQPALGQAAHLPPMTSTASYAGGIGMQTRTGTEILYRMQECRDCYPGPPPWDPVVGVRRPLRTTDPLARVVTITLQLEWFNRAETLAALRAIMTEEMGVSLP
jgi:hypothetical protein